MVQLPGSKIGSSRACVPCAEDRRQDWIEQAPLRLFAGLKQAVAAGKRIAEIGAPLLDRVREVVRERVRMFPTQEIRVERSAVGDGAGLLGAIALAARGIGM